MSDKNFISLNELFSKYKQDPEFINEVFKNRPYFDIMVQIINLRNDNNLTQKDLAKKAGMHQSRISKIESAKHDIRLSTLIKLAEALDSTITISFVPNWNVSEYEEVSQVVTEISSSDKTRTESVIEYACE